VCGARAWRCSPAVPIPYSPKLRAANSVSKRWEWCQRNAGSRTASPATGHWSGCCHDAEFVGHPPVSWFSPNDADRGIRGTGRRAGTAHSPRDWILNRACTPITSQNGRAPSIRACGIRWRGIADYLDHGSPQPIDSLSSGTPTYRRAIINDDAPHARRGRQPPRRPRLPGTSPPGPSTQTSRCSSTAAITDPSRSAARAGGGASRPHSTAGPGRDGRCTPGRRSSASALRA
jgi:hypothetical protein